ncbi:hypothetical protein EGR_10763 [Echinococcus granulosus]|uniref:Uncharacterized protein n=1 Tax=Echinococcus granulosus TaxID=6210 RepID=W6U1H3_ECHGR|nr:hypothetical protein EGR_10763 [Echinococcus granulosus]EUB54376.1 hypothetical protein EGR_10763 [Echinococcus granulosus]
MPLKDVLEVSGFKHGKTGLRTDATIEKQTKLKGIGMENKKWAEKVYNVDAAVERDVMLKVNEINREGQHNSNYAITIPLPLSIKKGDECIALIHPTGTSFEKSAKRRSQLGAFTLKEQSCLSLLKPFYSQNYFFSPLNNALFCISFAYKGRANWSKTLPKVDLKSFLFVLLQRIKLSTREILFLCVTLKNKVVFIPTNYTPTTFTNNRRFDGDLCGLLATIRHT